MGGNELLPQPVSNLPAIRVNEVYSDEHGSGQPVGGRSFAPSCAAAVPHAPALPVVLGLLMAGLGVATLARGWRKRRAA